MELILSAPGEVVARHRLMWASQLSPVFCVAMSFQGTLVIHWKLGSETLQTVCCMPCDELSGACSVHLTRAMGTLFFPEYGGLWIILRGKKCVISLLCQRRPSVHIMKCMIQLFDIFLFTFLCQAASHSCSSRNPAPLLFTHTPPFAW